MANFDKYTNYKDGYGVSGVIFGANATVLEVELNEMQEIQSNMLRNAINAITGDDNKVFITDLDDISMNDSIITIAKGATFIFNGYVVTLPQEYKIDVNSYSLADGMASFIYLDIYEEVLSGNTLKENGYINTSNTQNSWATDNRGFGETTKRKVVRFDIGEISSHTGATPLPTLDGFVKYNDYAAILTFGNNWMRVFAKEISINKILKKLDAIDTYDMRNAYGVEVDYKNGTVTRIAGSVGKNGGTDFDNIGAFNRNRCLVTEADGNVLAYLNNGATYPDYYDATTGLTTRTVTATNGTSVASGSRVNIMVEQDKFYYKVVPVEIDRISSDESSGFYTRKVRYYVSDTYKPGFKVHPAFIKKLKSGATLEFDKIYIAAYKSVAYDASGLVNDQVYEDSAEDLDFSSGGLTSITGMVPISGLYNNMTMNNMRRLLTNMDSDGFWRMKDITVMSMDILLFLVEYATFDAQSVLGKGYVNVIDKDNIFNWANVTGTTAPLGNTSSVPLENDGLHSISYRGEEDIYGGLFEFIEGFRADTKSIWTNTLHPFGSSPIYDNVNFHQDIGIYGFISAFGYNDDHDWMFIPTEAKGNSKLPVGDIVTTVGAYDGYGYVLAYGGNWYSGDDSGICSLRLVWDTNTVNCGSRIVYFPYKLGTNIG